MTRTANRLAFFVSAVLVLSAALLPASSVFAQAGTVRGFFGASPGFVAFIRWTELNGVLSGQYQALYIARTNPMTVESINKPFTGIRNGPNISITFFGVTWSGELRGSVLSLALPRRDGLLETLTMRAGSVEDYNRAALALKQSVARIAEEQARQKAIADEKIARRKAVLDADRAFWEVYQQLKEATRTLYLDTDFTKVLAAYAETWTTMQRHHEKLRTDAAKSPLDCYQLGTVKYDLGTLQYDMGSIRYHNGSFDFVRNSVLNRIGRVQRDTQALQEALHGLRQANAADPTKTASQPYLEQLSAMSAAAARMAEDQIQASLGVRKKAEAKAGEFNEKATRLLQDATEFVNSLTCTQ